MCSNVSPPRVVRSERTVINGNPDVGHISTSLIERQNLTMRMSMRRFRGPTSGSSEKQSNYNHLAVRRMAMTLPSGYFMTLKCPKVMALTWQIARRYYGRYHRDDLRAEAADRLNSETNGHIFDLPRHVAPSRQP